MELRCT